MQSQALRVTLSTSHLKILPHIKKLRQNFKKRKPTRRGFWFYANFKTGPIILGRKLWPVHRKYEINNKKKVVEIFSPKDKGHGNLMSQHFFCINVVDIETLVYAGEKKS